MATGGFRTLKAAMGRAGAFLAPTKKNEEGLRALLKEVLRDLGDLQTHTHTVDTTTSAAGHISSKPGSDTEGQAATTAITFGAFTID